MSEAIAQKLDEARALIEKGWCQGIAAATAGGTQRSTFDEDAACFCAFGAARKVAGYSDNTCSTMMGFLNQVAGGNVVDWNDAAGRTQAEVIEAFKKAADLARAAQ